MHNNISIQWRKLTNYQRIYPTIVNQKSFLKCQAAAYLHQHGSLTEPLQHFPVHAQQPKSKECQNHFANQQQHPLKVVTLSIQYFLQASEFSTEHIITEIMEALETSTGSRQVHTFERSISQATDSFIVHIRFR